MNVPFRVGQGFDVHVLVEGRPLIIGGVSIPYAKGLLGHSDADVLIHALIDALLGAAGLGDIGRHFPDTDSAYKNADSRLLLRQTISLIQSHEWQIVNIDATIHAQMPKMSPYIDNMIQNMAKDLAIPAALINIKAKTNEGLGFLGRQEGIAATVMAMLGKLD